MTYVPLPKTDGESVTELLKRKDRGIPNIGFWAYDDG